MRKILLSDKLTMIGLIISSLSLCISLLGNIYQANENKQIRIENQKYERDRDFENNLTKKLNYNLTLTDDRKDAIAFVGETKYDVKIKEPAMEIVTGFPKNRGCFIVRNQKIIKSSTLPTLDFLKDVKEHMEKKKNNNLNNYRFRLGFSQFPLISYGDDKYGIYYFFIMEGMDDSKSIHAVNYLFEKKNGNLECISEKLYNENKFLEDFEEGTYMYYLKTDYNYLLSQIDKQVFF
ncbi:hypothetical protein ACWY2R_07095 [Enterococcus avium]